MANYCLVHGGWHGGWVWKRIARSLREEGHDVYTPTMTGHSYAGMVISGVADLISERIAALIYLDAWVPEDGDSIFTLLPDPWQLSIIKEVAPYEGYMRPAIPAEALQVNERDRAWEQQVIEKTKRGGPLPTEAVGLIYQKLVEEMPDW